MIIIQNEYLTAKFNEIGAELKSLVCNNTEYIWNGDETYWKGSAPIIFPICSGLKDDQYILNGEKYTLGKHGFARFKEFEVASQTADSVVFLLRADEETVKQYPYDFELSITYKLVEKTLSVTYRIDNLNDNAMYFSIGAHEGYYCPEGIEDYDVIFPQNETLYSSVLEGNLIGNKKIRVIENSDRISLKYDYFNVDALVFKKLVSKSAVLKNRKTGRAVKLSFPDFPYFLLWSKPNANFICMEPWCGIADSIDTDQHFTKKEGIIKISPDGILKRTHTIEIIK